MPGNPSRDGNGAGHAPRLDIQGLRALAVSLVVLSHAGVAQFSGGYVGVDVFFVISGFLITSLLLRELSTTGRVSIRQFYARRALRLLPASTLVVVTTLAGAWLFLSKIRFTEYVGDALSSAFYAVNFRLALSGTDYLQQGSPPSPFQHFWSLAVEEQFYLVWPLLLVLSWKLARRRHALLAVPLVVLCLVSFWLSLTVTNSSAPWAYFGSHTRIWELGVGALLALWAARTTVLERIPAGLSAPMTWIGMASIVLAALRFDESTPFPGYHALLPVLGTALVLTGGFSPARFDARLMLARKPVVWLGGMSYGWYLWHWPFLIIGPKALGRPDSIPLALALCAAALLLASVTLRLVENPVRFHRAFKGRPNRALALGVGLSAFVALTSGVAAAFPPPISTGPPAPVLADALTTAPDSQARLTQLLETSGPDLPGNLSPTVAKIKDNKSAIYRDGCHANYEAEEAKPCFYGDPSSDQTIVLFGDSHAAQWFPALDRLAGEHHWKLVSLTKASCKMAEVTIIRNGKPYASCDTWRQNAIAAIEELRPTLVLVSSSEAGDPIKPMSDPRKEWAAGYQKTLQSLVDTGAEVATLLDNPWPKSDAVDCAAKHPLKLQTCANHLPRAIMDQTRRDALRDAAKSTDVAVIDPQPWLCTPEGDCPVVVGNTVVYRDDSHMAETFVESLAPLLNDRLSDLFGADLNGR
ncbi:acyltransferase family protein [Actinacidiphila soli]|uniref:acyltransferase family protein n=1 Tax=Actinacidiphila soli TaxID=2487275 RepID=UPI000FCB024C|nr:acyltransferase family protein [Actinacidiphila soli]